MFNLLFSYVLVLTPLQRLYSLRFLFYLANYFKLVPEASMSFTYIDIDSEVESTGQ